VAEKETQIVRKNLLTVFSFLMNNVSFYFRAHINNEEYAYRTLNKLYLQAAEKYVACC
jgi:hypothetical protein